MLCITAIYRLEADIRLLSAVLYGIEPIYTIPPSQATRRFSDPQHSKDEWSRRSNGTALLQSSHSHYITYVPHGVPRTLDGPVASGRHTWSVW
jgi:hypothetical protein